MTFHLDEIGRGLAFAGSIDAFLTAASTGACVVEAPPGTGKTTLVPPAVANLVEATPRRRVVVTQPRRVAARAAARRLADLSGTQVGGAVGFTVRGQARVSSDTVVEFVTPGVLLRRLIADPELADVAAVVLDEVHERSLDTDLLLGMLAEVRELRDDLVVVAMSATLDAAMFADLLGGAAPVPTVTSVTALHELDVQWAPMPGSRLDERGVRREFLDHIARVAADTHRRHPGHDALVFVPGVREVDHVVRAVSELCPDTDVLPLHGSLPPREQDVVIAGSEPNGRRRIVVSTSLAESSLTVPGVRVVIDSGLSREPRRDAARGMSGLVTVPASRASAVQRSGRAARLGPGVAVRCYDEATFAAMPAQVTPEIATSDLTDAALTMAAWGTPEGRGLRLPTAPPKPAMDDAVATLRELEAIDADGKLTATGQLLTKLPLEPRLGRALMDGAARVGATRAAEVIAGLALDVRNKNADLAAAISDLRRGNPRNLADQWQRETERLTKLATHATPGRASGHRLPNTASGATPAAVVTALAYPERLARRVEPGSSVYLLASGTRAALPPGSPLADGEWLAVADVARAGGRAAAGTGAVIRLAARLTEEEARALAGPQLVTETRAQWNGSTVVGREVEAIGAIELSCRPSAPTPQAAREAIADAIQSDGLGITLRIQDGGTADLLLRRLAFVHHHLGAPWPAVDDASLAARLDEWFGPELASLARGDKLRAGVVHDALERLLPWPEAARFAVLAPERIAVPSGSRVKVAYPPRDRADEVPVVAVKLQECFGLTETPQLADGRAPVLFHLLSPAGAPLAVTADLASFWAGPYADVRAQMRGRYPKHPWPEDPFSHVATARTKRRLSGD